MMFWLSKCFVLLRQLCLAYLCSELSLALSCIFCCTFWVNYFHSNFRFLSFSVATGCWWCWWRGWCCPSCVMCYLVFNDITVCDCHVCPGEPFFFHLFIFDKSPSPPLALSPPVGLSPWSGSLFIVFVWMVFFVRIYFVRRHYIVLWSTRFLW